jgi:hypothetical protein
MRDLEFEQIINDAYKLLDEMKMRKISREIARERLREIAIRVERWMKKRPLEGDHLSRAIFITQLMKLIDEK